MSALTAVSVLVIYCLTYATIGLAHEAKAQLPFEHPHAHDAVKAHAHLGWESKYFSEGRDTLDGDSLFTSSFELGWKHLTGGIWYGNSPDQAYDESQFSLALSQSIQDIEFYLGYTHLRFPFDDSRDNEIGAGISWSGLPIDIELAADTYYSLDADGYFVEISAAKEFSISNRLAFDLSGQLGINQGLVSDGHDGANHFALRLGLTYGISKSMSITAHSTYSWALNVDPTLPGDEQLIDFFHGGVGLQWSL